jgi:putative SOS response-associated peptidase YedK
MCGRYTIFTDADEKEMLDIIAAANLRYGGINDESYDSTAKAGGAYPFKTGEIFPTDRVPVLTLSSGGSGMTTAVYEWGFPGFGKSPRIVINAKRETIDERPMFRESFALRRCVIPSTGFYEWSHSGAKTKYLFNLPDTSMLYMAGVWRVYDGVPRFVILTGDANESVADVHNRMPLVLTRDNLKGWLTDEDAARELLSSPLPELTRRAG